MNRQVYVLGKLCVLLLVLLVLFGVAEVGARIWVTRWASEGTFGRYASMDQLNARLDAEGSRRYKPHHYLGYTLMPGFEKGPNRHNSLGYRGAEFPRKKPEGEYRIACLGGSTTYTSEALDDRFAYPAVMEAVLHAAGYDHVRVINAGCGGWNSWETLLNLQLRVLDLEPDMIIVYHAINDVHARIVWPPAAYRADDSGRREAVVANVFTASWWENSTLLRSVMISAGLAKPHAYRLPERLLFDAGTPNFYADIYRSQLKTDRYPSGIFEKHGVEEMLAANPPVHYARNLASMALLAQDRGAEVVFATFAHSRDFPDHPRSSSEVYARAIAEMNETMKAVAAERGAKLFDFASVFPDDKSLYADGRHVNVSGAQLKGRLFAEYLVRNRLIR